MQIDELIKRYRNLKQDPASGGFGVRAVRDLLVTELTGNLCMVVACDSDGGIGPKKGDTFFCPGYTLGRLAARVPMMELLASGAVPVLVVDVLSVEMEPTGKEIIMGVREEVALSGLRAESVVTGSTEDNVSTTQTGMGVVAIGFVENGDFRPGRSLDGDMVISLGIPKSAPSDTISLTDPDIADIWSIRQLNQLEYVHDILPVGSKGIFHEFNELAESAGLIPELNDDLCVDVRKSGGPSTTVLVSLPGEKITAIKTIFSQPVNIIGKLRKRK
ncbi:MAG: AIR synthase related protein [Ignavibacteriales bacterium]